MTVTSAKPPAVSFGQAVVATYRTHAEAEEAVRILSQGGLPIKQISIVGRNFESQEDVQGFYRPADAAVEGAGLGAWFGGFFGLLAGAMGFFVFPVVGAVMVLGPLSGLVAGAVGGAGIGALVNGLVQLGVPRDHALKYQEHLRAGEFLVVFHGTPDETAHAHQILEAPWPASLASADAPSPPPARDTVALGHVHTEDPEGATV